MQRIGGREVDNICKATYIFIEKRQRDKFLGRERRWGKIVSRGRKRKTHARRKEKMNRKIKKIFFCFCF